jgi:hypothetical protein
MADPISTKGNLKARAFSPNNVNDTATIPCVRKLLFSIEKLLMRLGSKSNRACAAVENSSTHKGVFKLRYRYKKEKIKTINSISGINLVNFIFPILNNTLEPAYYQEPKNKNSRFFCVKGKTEK